MKKQQYWQIVRGICILAVVMIHCPQGTDGLDQTVWLSIRQIINFPVALFIFMAGYFVNPSKVNKNWLKNRGRGRLFVPFLIWSSIYTIKNAVFSSGSLKSLVFSFVVVKSAAPFYYILVLLQLTILTPYLIRKRGAWMYLITPIYLIFLYIFNIITGSMPLFYETLFPAWFVFYIMGMDAREGKLGGVKVKGWMTGLALAASFCEAFFLMNIGCSVGFACSQIKFSSFIYASLIALWLSQHVMECKPSVLSSIGDCGFGIYFSHILVLQVVSKVLELMGVDVWIWKWHLTFVFTACLTYAFVCCIRRIFEGKKILRYIGFE